MRIRKRLTAVLLIVMLMTLLRPMLADKSAGDLKVESTESSETTKVEPTNRLTGETVNWFVIANGATNATSTNHRLRGTVGQPATEIASSDNHIVRGGFWQDFAASGADCLSGDVNESGSVDIDDVVYLIAYVFSGGSTPVPDECCGDVDGASGVDIDDIVYLIAFVFQGGAAPIDGCS
jgi:hypothetical protein